MANGDLEAAQTQLEALRELARPGKQTEVVEDLVAHLSARWREVED